MTQKTDEHCRWCGGHVAEPLGTGSNADGVYCGVACFTAANDEYLRERARFVAEQSHN